MGLLVGAPRLLAWVLYLFAALLASAGSVLYLVGWFEAGVVLRSVALGLLTCWLVWLAWRANRASVVSIRRSDTAVVLSGAALLLLSCVLAIAIQA